MKALQIKVYGKVQRVFFRKHTKIEADKLKLKGFVKNEEDKTVLIVIEGNQYQLDKFILWCTKGPELASVERIEVEDTEVQHFTDFQILK